MKDGAKASRIDKLVCGLGHANLLYPSMGMVFNPVTII